MLTSALISLLVSEFPDWSRPKILFYLNEIQNTIFTKSATTQMLMYDNTTGKDQILTTTSNIYEYLIDTTNGFTNNVWRVGSVYSNDVNDQTEVIKFDGYPGYSARILFRDNPGTSNYYIRCYRYPTQIVTEQNQLEVPASYHMTHVYEGMCGIIEKQRSGKSERWINYEKVLLPELIMKMSDANNIYTVPYKGF